MIKNFYCYAYAFLILMALTGLDIQPVAAHPHTFIAQETKIVFDEKGLAGFDIHWTLDEMFSVMISEDFDEDKNGSLSKQEVTVIKEKAFGYIASYNYYIHIRIDGKPFAIKFIRDFNASLNNGKLSYNFFIPCHITAAKTLKKIILSPYDPEYYSAIYFPDKKHFIIENSDHFVIETKVERDMSTLIYFKTVNPLAIFLNFKLK